MDKNKLVLRKTFDSKAPNQALTVVMIHGIASDSSTYQKALDHFKEVPALGAIRFVTFDLLGSGKSLKDDKLNYDYDDQLTALHNSILELDTNTPLVLVGHSLGTFIVTRYASVYKNEISQLILISPPIYTKNDFRHPAFMLGIDAFKKAVSIKNPHILTEKAFINSMDKIVLDQENYSYLAKLKLPVTLIYGDEDQLIASYNVPGLVKENSDIVAIKTHGRHGVTRDKYIELEKLLKKELDAKDL